MAVGVFGELPAGFDREVVGCLGRVGNAMGIVLGLVLGDVLHVPGYRAPKGGAAEHVDLCLTTHPTRCRGLEFSVRWTVARRRTGKVTEAEAEAEDLAVPIGAHFERGELLERPETLAA